MYSRRFTLVFAALLLMLGASARANLLPYQVGNGSSVSANDSDPGLVLHTQLSSSLAGRSFSLDDGDSVSFPFFRIWTNEVYVNNDDEVAKPITAILDFSTPDVDATINGQTKGVAEFLGFYQYGKVKWNGPAIVDAGDRVFSVSLNDAKFNEGIFFSLGDGKCLGAKICATVHQCRSGEPGPGPGVPLPAAAYSGLGMLGALGIGNAIRRVRRAA